MRMPSMRPKSFKIAGRKTRAKTNSVQRGVSPQTVTGKRSSAVEHRTNIHTPRVKPAWLGPK